MPQMWGYSSFRLWGTKPSVGRCHLQPHGFGDQPACGAGPLLLANKNHPWKCPVFLPPLCQRAELQQETETKASARGSVGSVMWRIYGCSTIQVSGVGSWIHITQIASVKLPLLCTAEHLHCSAWARAQKRGKKRKGITVGFCRADLTVRLSTSLKIFTCHLLKNLSSMSVCLTSIDYLNQLLLVRDYSVFG